ncbi:MAG TPA: hypothetical protein VFV38_24620 [Ktedonobacteraceae bacterium]|nr:hypothetical protein [Ktedonobacteraceae bacterium]
MVLQEQHSVPFALRQVGFLPAYLYGHTYEIVSLRFSPDGSLLASATEGGRVVLIWDVKNQALLRALPFPSAINDLAFSPDGTCLAVSAGGKVSCWDGTGEDHLTDLPCHPSDLAFSPTGKELLCVDAQGIVSFWNLAQERQIASFQAIPEGSRPGWWAISPSRDLSCLVLTTQANQAFLWLFESDQGEAVPLATIPADYNDGVVFSPDGTLLACLATPPRQRKPRVQVYDLQTQTYRMDLVSPTALLGTERSQPLAFSPENALLVVADLYGNLWFWDINKQQLIAQPPAHPDPGSFPYYGIRALAWSPASQYLAMGGWEQRDPSFSGERFCVKLWEVNRQEEKRERCLFAR